jgi:hypothetical protein
MLLKKKAHVINTVQNELKHNGNYIYHLFEN